MNVLRREEAAERSRLLHVRSSDVELHVTRGEQHFGSVSRVRFECRAPWSGHRPVLPEIDADLDGALRRLLVEGRADLKRAMRTLAADRQGTTGR